MSDIFAQMNSLFRGQKPEGEVQTFVLHRFFASDPAFAAAAKEIGGIYDNDMVTEIWRGALPRLRQAPRFKYPATKKRSYTLLVDRVAEAEWMSRMEAEAAVEMIKLLDGELRLCQHYGVEKKDA